MGRPPKHSPAEICRVIALHPEPIVTAADVQEEVGLTQRGMAERLKTLVEEGYLDTKKVGSSGRVFWLTDRGRATLSDA